nr:hypothetical protein GCM10017611_07250 [Rhodococcus wratislaviensis]
MHTAAITQIRMSGSRGNLYYKSKIAEGKTPREAKRCLRRRLADHVWRVMIADERRREAADLVLTEGERETVDALGATREGLAGVALRSKIVFGCAAGASNNQVAEDLQITPSAMARWRRRFVADRLDGLVDEPRPGRPPSILLDQVEDVVIATLAQTPPNATQGLSRVDGACRIRMGSPDHSATITW